MDQWDFDLFNEKMGNLIEYGIVVGRSLAGKTEICNQMGKCSGYQVIDMKAIADKLKASLGTEEEPFEGEVPLADVEKEVARVLNSGQAGVRSRYLFDGYTHDDADKFIEFIKQFGLPQFVLNLTATDKYLK